MSIPHDYLQRDSSRDLKNEVNYSHMANMFKIREIMNMIMDLNIISSTK
jgi:hypothetical protein